MLLYVLLSTWLVGFFLTVRYLKRKWPEYWANSSYLLAVLWPLLLLGLGFWVVVWKLKK